MPVWLCLLLKDTLRTPLFEDLSRDLGRHRAGGARTRSHRRTEGTRLPQRRKRLRGTRGQLRPRPAGGHIQPLWRWAFSFSFTELPDSKVLKAELRGRPAEREPTAAAPEQKSETCSGGERAGPRGARRKFPAASADPPPAALGQWPLEAVRRRPIGGGAAGSPAKWRRRRRRDGCGVAAALAMPGSRRKGPCLRPAVLRRQSGGGGGGGEEQQQQQLTRQRPAEPPAEEAPAAEGGAGRGLPAGEAPRPPRPSREAAVRGAAGTAGTAPGAPRRWGPGPARPCPPALERRGRRGLLVRRGPVRCNPPRAAPALRVGKGQLLLRNEEEHLPPADA